jgi:hypothetical protein
VTGRIENSGFDMGNQATQICETSSLGPSNLTKVAVHYMENVIALAIVPSKFKNAKGAKAEPAF